MTIDKTCTAQRWNGYQNARIPEIYSFDRLMNSQKLRAVLICKSYPIFMSFYFERCTSHSIKYQIKYPHTCNCNQWGMLTTFPQCNFSLEFPEILSQNLICYHRLSVSGNSEMMHCGKLMSMPYYKDSIGRCEMRDEIILPSN